MKCLFNGMLVVALALVLAGCGGGWCIGRLGGPGCSSPNPTPPVGGTTIVGTMVLSSPSTYTPIVIVNVSAVPVTNAVVTVNGQMLAYNSLTQQYEGSGAAAVTPDAAGKFNLSVTANGSTYTASANALTSVPVITVPAPFNAALDNTISWTSPGGMTGTGMLYIPAIKPNSAGASPVYSPASTVATNAFIPANTTVAGTGYIMTLSAYQAGMQIANAAPGSNFGVGANSSINFATQ